MRCFTAVLLPEATRAAIAGAMRTLDRHFHDAKIPSPRWEREENLHCTLNFFGETNEALIARFLPAAQSALRSIDPPELDIRELGTFPNAHRPRILWIGVHDASQRILAAQQALDAIAGDLGMHHEEGRAFHPHITIGRWKKPPSRHGDALAPILEGEYAFGLLTIPSIALMKSVTREGGSVYSVEGDLGMRAVASL